MDGKCLRQCQAKAIGGRVDEDLVGTAAGTAAERSYLLRPNGGKRLQRNRGQPFDRLQLHLTWQSGTSSTSPQICPVLVSCWSCGRHGPPGVQHVDLAAGTTGGPTAGRSGASPRSSRPMLHPADETRQAVRRELRSRFESSHHSHSKRSVFHRATKPTLERWHCGRPVSCPG